MTPLAPAPAAAPAPAPGRAGPAEPVEVRCAPDGEGPPALFLWRADLWLVREAHRDLGSGSPGWRVRAGQGPGRPEDSFRLSCDGDGRWWLLRVPS